MKLFLVKYLGSFSGQLKLCWRRSFLACTIIFSTEVGIRGPTTSGPKNVFQVVSQKCSWPHELIDDRLKRIKGVCCKGIWNNPFCQFCCCFYRTTPGHHKKKKPPATAARMIETLWKFEYHQGCVGHGALHVTGSVTYYCVSPGSCLHFSEVSLVG